MKKRLTFILLLLSFCLNLSAQRLLPITVEQYLDERSYSDRFMSKAEARESSRFFPSRIIDGCEMVDAFIAIENESVISLLQAHGVNVNCIFDDFLTAQVPVDRLVEISRLHGVTDVEISQKLSLCTDTTLSVTHVNQILDGLDYGLPQNYDGSGVIVGIIDENSFRSLAMYQIRIQELQAQIDDYQKQFDNDSIRLHVLMAERIARERYLMKRPNADIFIMSTDPKPSDN